MTTTVTDHDRHIAAVIVGSMSDVVLGNLLKRDIAQALADERTKAYRAGYVDADNGNDPKVDLR